MIYQTFLFIFVSVCVIQLTNCSFPKCEDILLAENGKPICALCTSSRVQEKCEAICQSQCNEIKSTTSSHSISTSARRTISNNRTAIGHGPKNKSHINGSGKNQTKSSTSSTSSTCNDIDPCVPLVEANKKMKQRCYDTSMQPSCAAHCGYDTPFSELKAAFKNKECSIPDAREFLYSAANRKNNVKCCTEKGVLDGNRAEVCEPFCNPGSDKWTGKLKAEYLRCLGQFDTIMACHWASARP